MWLKKQAIALAVASAFQSPLFAQTLPSGGTVAAGSAAITESPGNLFVSQGTDKAIINWQSFSIGAGGTVNFSQPSASSVALNRVLGNDPSRIYGNLFANGRVFLVNPTGIYFAPGAQVSVGSLVASTLSISDDDFLAGRYVFANAGGAGSVVNQGNINSFSGYTALLAPQVTNEGFIFANTGGVALAAGDRVSLDMVGDNLIRVSVDQAALDAAVINTGNIEALGGNVLLSTRSANALLDTVINTQGLVRAARMIETDGAIVLDGGSAGTVRTAGQLEGASISIASGGDLEMRGNAFTLGGPMTLASGGTLSVAAAGTQDASVSSSGGQTVSARSLAVTADNGRFASLSNSGGDQLIQVSGGAGVDVVASGGGFASISHFDPNPVYRQTIRVTDADHINVVAHDRGSQQFPGAAGIFAGTSPQAISITGTGRNAILVGAEGATGQSVINAISQDITAGETGQSGSITVTGTAASNVFAGISTSSDPTGTQSIGTSGTLSVLGGSATSTTFGAGVFHNGQGQQTVRAAGIDVIAGSTGSGNGAFLSTSNGAHQWIEVPGGTIRVISGQGGANNTAGMGTNGRGDQTIVGRPDILVAGGATSNASIQAGIGKTQVIEAHNITLTNGSDSPGNSAGVILAPTQRISATGDVILTAQSGTGTASGVRIGSPTAGTPTDLVLDVDGDLVLVGGTTGTNGAGLGGGGTGTAFDNNITVNVKGDALFDAGTGGGGTRLGSSALTAVAGGNISVTARSIRFTGTAPAAIRTTGNVELHAMDFITQDAYGFILADALTTTSSGSTRLGGANHVSRFDGTSWFGDLTLNNIGPLEVTNLVAINAALTNAGPLTLGVWNALGDTTIRTTGAGADLAVTNTVGTGGAMTVDVSGNMTVTGVGFNSAGLLAGGDQTINVTGGSLDVRSVDGGFAQIASWNGNQTITVRDGDHLRLDGGSGGGGVFMSAALGTQALSITGSGRNAMEIGVEGGTGTVSVFGSSQTLTAGSGAQSGSITLTGTGVPDAFVQSAAFAAGSDAGTQTVSTTGALAMSGGVLVRVGQGPQTIVAGSVAVRGRASGTGGAGVNSMGGGEQSIDVAGDLALEAGTGGAAGIFADGEQFIHAGSLSLQGGASGAGNGAFIGAAAQNIQIDGDIILAGSAGGRADIAANPVGTHGPGHQRITATNIRVLAGPGNGAAIASNAGGGQAITATGDIQITGSVSSNGAITAVGRDALQTVSARNLMMANATSSPGNSAAVILGSHQRINVDGDITLTAGGGTGTASGVRVGGAVERRSD